MGATSEVSVGRKDAASEVSEVSVVFEVFATFASEDAMAAASANSWVSEDELIHNVHAQVQSKV